MSKTPPKVLKSLVRKMFPSGQWEEIEGDLEEDFTYNYQQHGKFRARCYYLLDVLRLIQLYFILKKRTRSNNTVMNKLLFFHLKYGFRSLYRQKLYQSLNILTLTLGFSCFMLIFLFVYNQRQKDNFISNPEQIVRLDFVDRGTKRQNIHGGMPQVLKSTFPEIQHYARVSPKSVEVSLEGKKESFTQTLNETDEGFLDIFQLKLVLGKRPQVLDKEILISQSLAGKLFGNQNAVGQTVNVTTGNRKPHNYAITGILEDLPINASFSNDLISLSASIAEHSLTASTWSSFTTYFKVTADTDLPKLAERIPKVLSEHTENSMLTGSPYHFRSFSEIKTDPSIGDLLVSSVDGQAIFIFTIVGIVVLFLAIANYINLLAALSLRRTQEMSIKKVMGASSRSLVTQQLIESIIICSIAMAFSTIIVAYFVPLLETYLNAPLKFTSQVMSWVILLMASVPILLTIFASLYPAILMSGMRFTELLKGKVSHSHKGRFVRNGLLTLQFTISTFLIVGTLTFVKQIGFIKSLHKTDVIGKVLIIKGELGKKHEVTKLALNALPEVDLTSISSMIAGPNDNRGVGLANGDFENQFDMWVIDSDYLNLMNLEVVRGDNFYHDSRSDKSHVLVNEALAEIAKRDVLGMSSESFTGTNKIIGIMKDFPIQSAKEKVEPAMFIQAAALKDSPMFSGLLTKVAIKLNTNDYEKAIAKIEGVWEEIYPDQPFDIEFMDDRLDRVYTSELRMGQLFGTFTGVAILISCLGILGLLTYLIEVKMKELGIRKVLGAGFFSQVKILTMNIWKVMLISNVIAFPLSYYFLKDWLNSFAHRTNISSELFIGTALIFCAIVALSALWQVLKLNRINPTEVLRNE